MTADDRYFPIGQFELERQFAANPLMAAVKLARYKFVAKMLSSRDQVLDLGCGNGYSSLFYAEAAANVLGMDLYADIEAVRERFRRPNLSFLKGDILNPPESLGSHRFTAIVAIDVIEHFYREDGERIISGYSKRLRSGGMMILGTPSRYSEAYRSPHNRALHFHEYAPEELRALCDRHFGRTLLFSMNDEVVHTGFEKLAWFFFVLAFV